MYCSVHGCLDTIMVHIIAPLPPAHVVAEVAHYHRHHKKDEAANSEPPPSADAKVFFFAPINERLFQVSVIPVHLFQRILFRVC